MLRFVQKLLPIVLTVDVQQAAAQGAQLGHGHGPPVAAADIFPVCVNLPLQ